MAQETRRKAVAIAWMVLLAGAFCLALTSRPPVAPAASRLPVRAEGLSRLELEERAETAMARWQQDQNGELNEPDGDAKPPDSAPSTNAYDGVYAGAATMRADGRPVTFSVKVTNGIGSGTQMRRDCGSAPLSLRISAWGDVSGMVLIFSSTCLKTELAIRGRAVGGTLLLRVGNQFVDLTKRD
jgi:hypothetical protein